MEADKTALQAREAQWCELMTAAQAGDGEAYHRLLSELGSVIERYLRRHFGRLPFEEDCIQETLMNLHKARHTWAQGRPFGPWLFTIVRHTAIDSIRHSERYRDVLDSYAEHRSLLDSNKGRADTEAEAGVLLAELPNSQREILVLMKLQGFTAREAAGQLGISATAAKVRCHRAMTALRRLMKTQTPDNLATSAQQTLSTAQSPALS